MAVGDIYEVTYTGRLYSQQVSCVFHYEQDLDYVSLEPTKAHDVLNSWNAQVLPKMLPLMTSDMAQDSIRVRNLFNSTEKAELLLGGTGTYDLGAGAETLPSFVAVSFSLTGDNAAVAQGQKRIPGISEAAQVDNVLVTAAGASARWQTFADQLKTPLKSHPAMLSDIWLPVIVKRVREGLPGAYTYRLPSSQAEKIVSHILVAAFNILLTSQISRKIGVGG